MHVPSSCKPVSMIRAKYPVHSNSLVVAVIAAVVIVAGCSKTTLTKSQHRVITGEIVAAAQKNASLRSEVTVSSGVLSFQMALRGEIPADNVYVTLADSSRSVALERALAELARRHKLSIVERSSSGVYRFDLAYHGMRTHTVRAVTPLVARANSASLRGSMAGRKLGIIIDDLGNDRASGESVISLPFPVTVSVLPNLAFSTELAEEAYRRGDQVLLHLPMQAESSGVQPEPSELRVGMSSQQVQSALSRMLESVPHVVGVNNHEGSRATSDAALMEALMPALRERGLFFIDSRTTAATVAYSAAERAGIPAASRKVFLDDTPQSEPIRAQLKVAAQDAMRDGSAIAIGHPYAATISSLGQDVPALEAGGIRMVFASDLVH